MKSDNTSAAREWIVGLARERAEITLTRHPLPRGTRLLTSWVVDFVANLVGDLFDDYVEGRRPSAVGSRPESLADSRQPKADSHATQ